MWVQRGVKGGDSDSSSSSDSLTELTVPCSPLAPRATQLCCIAVCNMGQIRGPRNCFGRRACKRGHNYATIPGNQTPDPRRIDCWMCGGMKRLTWHCK